jgi:hypothetical protein
VTRPVTQVAEVAVKSASIYGTLCPSAALIGSERRRLPTMTAAKNPSIIILVVEMPRFDFLLKTSPPLKHFS